MTFLAKFTAFLELLDALFLRKFDRILHVAFTLRICQLNELRDSLGKANLDRLLLDLLPQYIYRLDVMALSDVAKRES